MAYLQTIKDYRYSSLFWFVGNHYLYNNDELGFSFGIGPGINYTQDEFDINFMAGLAVFSFPDETVLWPTIEIGTFYRF